jgi:hypothetical protein
MRKFFSNTKAGTALRGLFRAVLVCATAFGLKLSPEQIAAVLLVAESGLQLGSAVTEG